MNLLKKLMVVCGTAAAFVTGCASSGASAPAASAAAVPAGEPFKLPDGQVAVHYWRPDGNYAPWGLHSWESFQKKEEAGDEWAKKEQADRPVPGVTWFAPKKMAGVDDFGAYFLLPEAEYSNGRVNYILHIGDKKDQCNQDKFFLTSVSREAWVVSGDCKVYTSKEEALKAKAAKGGK